MDRDGDGDDRDDCDDCDDCNDGGGDDVMLGMCR